MCGRPVLWWTWRAAQQAGLDGVVVATGDADIADAAASWGAAVVWTRRDHENGTERVAEAATHLQADAIVDVQGDEPAVQPAAIGALADRLRRGARWVTAAAPLVPSDHERRDVVKVVIGRGERALWFSRAPLGSSTTVFRHVGLYGWSTAMLGRLSRLPPHPLEHAEGLEQLRGLLAGHRLDTVFVDAAWPSVDTLDDLADLRARWRPAP